MIDLNIHWMKRLFQSVCWLVL